jgi:hypothetical protein
MELHGPIWIRASLNCVPCGCIIADATAPLHKGILGASAAEERPMTVFVYVNTSEQVGDAEHVKVSPPRTPLKNGLRKTTTKAWPLSRFWSEPDRLPHRSRHACDLGAGDRLAGARIAISRPHGIIGTIEGRSN